MVRFFYWLLPIGLVSLIVGCFLLQLDGIIEVRTFGIIPRVLEQWTAIFTMPLVHANLDHLLSNIIPLTVALMVISYYYKSHRLLITITVWIASGLWLWMAGRANLHIGASGLVYGYITFICVSGLMSNSKRLAGIAFLLIFVYGSLVWGLLPYNPNISWDGHLFGALAGLICALFIKEPVALKDHLFSDKNHQDYINYAEAMKRIDEAFSTTSSTTNTFNVTQLQQLNAIKANLIDLHNREIFYATVQIQNGIIVQILNHGAPLPNAPYILPGFIDAHVHIESSMLTPYEFSRAALIHGTIATISDPHEIANVMGMDGINFMIESASTTPMHIHLGAPSCVPATLFETAGASITAKDIAPYFLNGKLKYLAEVMNFPGVISGDADMLEKINLAKKFNVPIDGHAPGLTGADMDSYFSNGITTDHECTAFEEAKAKMEKGVNILIREGSAAKNFEALIPLLNIDPEKVMFCSDDKHPDDLQFGHINLLVKRAISLGYNLFDVLKAACINPLNHYRLHNGALRIGDKADFIEIDNLKNFKITKTFINGAFVADGLKCFLPFVSSKLINNFNCSYIRTIQLEVMANSDMVKCIVPYDGQLITDSKFAKAALVMGKLQSNVETDVLKIVVVNRYFDAIPAVGFIHGVGLKKGAFASSVAHDSHNIIALGTNDEDIAAAINIIISSKGGLSYCHAENKNILPLPIGGIMSNEPIEFLSDQYSRLSKMVKEAGCLLNAPYMTLSFMALPVIPKLKMTDKGLFDVQEFNHTTIQ